MRERLHGALPLFLVAALSSLVTLTFYYVGEEGIVTITSLEMWQRGNWLRLWLYGTDVQHGVFTNWLVIPLAATLGWDHVLQAARLVMIASTTATGAIVYGLLRRLGRDATQAGLAAVAYITSADILIYRGWLAYRDPLFGLLVFGAIAALWIGAREKRVWWLLVAGVLTFAAYLTKGLTAYAFVGSAALVFLVRRETRPALLRPAIWLPAAVALTLPVAWLYLVQGGSGQAMRFTSEIEAKLVVQGLGAWAWKLVWYPVDTLLRLLPASGFALYLLVRHPTTRRVLHDDPVAASATWIALLGFLPYWLAPQSHFRYLLPIAPLAAIVFALLIVQGGARLRRITFQCMWALVAAKLVFVAVAFPLYQKSYRGANYAVAARSILERTGGHALYTKDVSASGLAVTAYLDVARLPRPALTFPPTGSWEGYLIAREPDPALGAVVTQYRLGGDTVYLLCRGAVCERPAK